MADTQETIADIIAEMRAREDLDGGDMVDNFDIYNGEYGGWDALMLIKAYADRLDAAHRRERGDCAKLREALETLRELLGDLLRLEDAEYHNDFSNFCDIIDAALSAPMRNCDRFATADEAFHAWNNTTDTPGGGAYVGLIDWLFAPATEKEGANYGNE